MVGDEATGVEASLCSDRPRPVAWPLPLVVRGRGWGRGDRGGGVFVFRSASAGCLALRPVVRGRGRGRGDRG
ncbi:MAG: hypothetical protein PVJ75_10360, partial [Chloroflexota bacterium]